MNHSGLPVSKFNPAMQAQIAAQLYPHATNPNNVDRKTSASVPQRRVGDGPLATPQAQTGHSGKYLVRLVSFRRRLLDEDNLCAKFHVDSLRYAGLIPSDAPDRCKIETTQSKVGTKEEERTVITIIAP